MKSGTAFCAPINPLNNANMKKIMQKAPFISARFLKES